MASLQHTSASPESSIIAGPLVRHCDASQLNFWLVTTKAYNFTFTLYKNGECHEQSDNISYRKSEHLLLLEVQLENSQPDKKSELQQIQIGESAYINLITIYAQDGLAENALSESAFPENITLYYDIIASLDDTSLQCTDKNNEAFSVSSLSSLLYTNQTLPSLMIKPTIEKLLHGSCRKPHDKSEDALKQVDSVINDSIVNEIADNSRPSMLIMSGDQVYVDDVAGPTLSAIHQVIDLLGLYDEAWEPSNNTVNNSQALFKHKHNFYQRINILPEHQLGTLFGKKTNPIFTSTHADNHLITLSEVMAMYLLTWSPQLWERVNIEEPPAHLSQDFKDKYFKELTAIKAFYEGLYEVRRAMAHIPVYMIFDDHDITDDWNLTRGWEEAAYNHPFSKQIIGNALVGYWLCQGWGNAPDKFTGLLADQAQYFNPKGYKLKNELIDKLFDFDQWNYNLNTSPKIVVLDTRTQRWRSESNANKPSGLMDWESLCDFQQALIKEPSVIVVTAAPIYGVKLIETIQRIFTFFGKPLVVDAENWMAHSGTANVILNIFKNTKTPANFIILSGDVHYSFVYEVTHRFRRNSAKIIQVTCSGIKNTFPEPLLTTLEKLNKVLYATYSPLNWFTKRRSMKIRARKPNTQTSKHLHNGSGIGLLALDKEGREVITKVITSQGKTIEFIKHDADDH